MSNPRWVTAIHEAGHGVASIVLGGTCSGLVLLEDGSGLAGGDDLSADSHAFSIAAGPLAERLADIHDAPTSKPKPQPVSVDEIESLDIIRTAPAMACAMVRAPADRRRVPSDARRIAEWAIDGCEDTPDRWAERVRFAEHIANKIIDDHVAAIIAVAKSLYLNGSLSRDEILTILQPATTPEPTQ